MGEMVVVARGGEWGGGRGVESWGSQGPAGDQVNVKGPTKVIHVGL